MTAWHKVKGRLGSSPVLFKVSASHRDNSEPQMYSKKKTSLDYLVDINTHTHTRVCVCVCIYIYLKSLGHV